MTVNFDEAVKILLVDEGGFTDDSRDRGGITNYGITKATLLEAIEADIVPRETTIRTLTKSNAIDIYSEFYWKRLNLDKIDAQSIANKILNVSVNVGLHWGVILLQRAVHAATGDVLEEDGILGPKTLEAVNSAPAASLLAAYRSEQAGYYRSIVTKDDSQSCFLNGWISRAYR